MAFVASEWQLIRLYRLTALCDSARMVGHPEVIQIANVDQYLQVGL